MIIWEKKNVFYTRKIWSHDTKFIVLLHVGNLSRQKARFSKFSNKYYHIPGGANSSFYKSHFINIKLRLITKTY